MSVIVGLRVGKRIYMGCDSAATADDGVRRHIKIKKVMRYQDKYFVGIAGSVRVANLLSPKTFKVPKNIDDFPEAIRQMLMESGSITSSDEDQTQLMNSNVLIAVKNDGLYEILSDFQLNEVATEYSAIGSGSEFAFGCLFGLENSKLSPEEKITKALAAACHFHGFCYPPFMIEEI
jgi:ATP-dependent protease HslVU (ClpYQ) peptidase subunit